MWNNEYKSMQGNVGLGRAIAYFTTIGCPILLPLNDTQKYDLAVDIDGILSRVQVKTCACVKASGNYEVALKNSGGSSGVSKTRHFDNTSCDLLFVLLSDETMLLIPSREIDSKSTWNITQDRRDKYTVEFYSGRATR